MQAMARLQAAAGSVVAGDDYYPFSTMAIWRDKLQADLSSTGAGGSSEHKTRLLLEQGRDVEQAVLGCLKDTLFDLHEGVVWGLLDPVFEAQQRQALVNGAANELNTDKQLCVQLAREHGVLAEYTAQVQKPINHTLADYERAGELKFGLLVWRANLKRDAALSHNAAGGGDEDVLATELLFRGAYSEALRLIRRCGNNSLQFWAAQQAGSAPTEASKQRLYRTAMQRVQNALLELAETFGVDKMALRHLFQVLPDPEAATAEEEVEEAEGGVDGESGAEFQGICCSSKESETSSLGL